jgi:hypothetical protein
MKHPAVKQGVNINTVPTVVPPTFLQFYTFDGVLQFGRGIFEGSNFAPTGSSLAKCFDSQTSIISGANATFNSVMANTTLYGFILGVKQGLGVLYNFGNLGSDCIAGVMGMEATLS